MIASVWVTLSGWVAATIAGIGALLLKRQNDHLAQQNGILERQVAGEEADRRAAREATQRADVRVHNAGRDGLGYRIDLVNIGAAPATHVHAFMAKPETLEPWGPAVDFPGMLRPGDDPVSRVAPVGEGVVLERRPAVIVVTWRDTAERQHVSDHPVDW